MEDRKRAITGRDDQIRTRHQLRQFIALARIRKPYHAARTNTRARQRRAHRVSEIRPPDQHDTERRPTGEHSPLAV
jgi:hypothetical protein